MTVALSAAKNLSPRSRKKRIDRAATFFRDCAGSFIFVSLGETCIMCQLYLSAPRNGGRRTATRHFRVNVARRLKCVKLIALARRALSAPTSRDWHLSKPVYRSPLASVESLRARRGELIFRMCVCAAHVAQCRTSKVAERLTEKRSRHLFIFD